MKLCTHLELSEVFELGNHCAFNPLPLKRLAKATEMSAYGDIPGHAFSFSKNFN